MPLVTVIVCAVPGVKVVPAMDCTLSVSPSASVSLLIKSSVPVVVSSSTVKLSSTAMGAALESPTVPVTLAVSDNAPSLTV